VSQIGIHLRSKHFVLWVLVIVAVMLAAGLTWFFIGHDVFKQNSAASSVSIQPPLASGTTSTNKPFTISPPSTGPAYRSTEPLPLAAITGNRAVIFTDSPDAPSLREGQLVLLYDDQDQLLDLVGRVSSIKQGTQAMAALSAIQITIEERATIPTTSAKKAEIILAGINNALRLPDTAIIKTDENTPPFVWEAIKQNDETAILKRTPIKSYEPMDYDYGVVQIESYQSNLYVLFPNADFQEGMTIPVREILYAPYAPDANAHAMSIKYDRIFDSIAVAAGGNETAPLAPASGGEACPQSCGESQTVTDFIETIRALGDKQAQP
jgi:hypothetical protein